MLSDEQYIEERIIDQLNYYNQRACKYKFLYFLFNILNITFSVSIPVLTILSTGTKELLIKVLIAVLGSLITLSTSILSLCKFHELWMTYRSASEKLKSFLYLYMTKTSPYNTDQSFSLFASDCENIMMQTNTLWLDHILNKSNKS